VKIDEAMKGYMLDCKICGRSHRKRALSVVPVATAPGEIEAEVDDVAWAEIASRVTTEMLEVLTGLALGHPVERQAVQRVVASLLPYDVVVATKVQALAVQLQQVSYLELPEVISQVAADRRYQVALPYGWAFYREEQHEVTEDGRLQRFPYRYTAAELAEFVMAYVLPDEPLFSLIVPLPWRVGFVVGFLSGLWVSQPDEAVNAMAQLAALVAPLLVSSSTDGSKQPGYRK
jgi:hypothetical protein